MSKIRSAGHSFAAANVMRLLISNDDGIHSPGLAALAGAARSFGDVLVVAPDGERSSSSHAISSALPLRCRAAPRIGGAAAYRVNGTPADAVTLGLHLWPRIDVVLSGLNLGFNLGPAAWHSGTLAAARQAALLGVRGIAVSIPATLEADLDPLASWVHEALKALLGPLQSLPFLVNVNVPRDPRGLMWTRASTEGYDGRIVPGHDGSGRDVYWFDVEPMTSVDHQSDRWAVEQHWVSMTPISLDVTDEAALSTLRHSHPFDTVLAAQTSPQVSSAAEAAQVRQDEAQAPGSDVIRPAH
jgi:5'-nucleotidase